MPEPMIELPPPRPELLAQGPVPPDALFFDTNCALHPDVARAQNEGRLTLISSVVYAELITRRRGPRGLDNIDANLVDRGLRVVSFDVVSARCYFDLCRQVRFDMPPLLRTNEDERDVRNRLRFDLLVFAAALRHRAMLVTDNTRDFEHFPYPAHWAPRARLFP